MWTKSVLFLFIFVKYSAKYTEIDGISVDGVFGIWTRHRSRPIDWAMAATLLDQVATYFSSLCLSYLEGVQVAEAKSNK